MVHDSRIGWFNNQETLKAMAHTWSLNPWNSYASLRKTTGACAVLLTYFVFSNLSLNPRCSPVSHESLKEMDPPPTQHPRVALAVYVIQPFQFPQASKHHWQISQSSTLPLLSDFHRVSYDIWESWASRLANKLEVKGELRKWGV